MKILILLVILSTTSLSSSKKKRHHSSATTLKPLHELKALDTSIENDKAKLEDKGFSKNEKFNCRGILRRIFALETVYQESSSNVVCSPVSALLPLGKLALGAEGDTYTELTKMIGASNDKKLSRDFKKLINNLKFIPGVMLDVASRIYVSDEVELSSKFVKDSKDIFDSAVFKISFNKPEHVVSEINEWVSKQTKGMIPEFLSASQISADSVLVIVNAIYFRGKWKDPFTTVEVSDFYSPVGPKKVALMTRRGTYYNYTKSDILDSQIIEIPYEEMEATFIVILPNKNLSLPLLLNQLKLAPSLLNTEMRNMVPTKIDVTIPKFKITTNLDLKDLYKKIGIKHTLKHRSGLKRIARNQELRISSAIQKAIIEVHERGTEAAAASAVNLVAMTAPTNILTFLADHPFLFYIQAYREQLFAGIFIEP